MTKVIVPRLFGVVVQRIGHIPSKDTMMVRFHPALPPDMLKTPIRAFFLSCSISNRASTEGKTLLSVFGYVWGSFMRCASQESDGFYF